MPKGSTILLQQGLKTAVDTTCLIVSVLTEVEDNIQKFVEFPVYSVILVVIGWKNFRALAMLNGGPHAPPSNPRHARTSSRRSNTEFNSD
jgi:hypothetical protein